jgi:hypothetical protein
MTQVMLPQGIVYTLKGRIERSNLILDNGRFILLERYNYVEGNGYFLVIRFGFFTTLLNAFYIS